MDPFKKNNTPISQGMRFGAGAGGKKLVLFKKFTTFVCKYF